MKDTNRGEAEAGGEKVYRTGEGGYLAAIAPGLGAILLVALGVWVGIYASLPKLSVGEGVDLALGGVPVLYLLPLIYLIRVAVISFMRGRNCAVIVGQAGLTMRDWRARETFVPWARVTGVVWSGIRRFALSIEILDELGAYHLERITGWYRESAGQIQKLRDEIVRKRGFAEVTETASRFRGTWRTWRA